MLFVIPVVKVCEVLKHERQTLVNVFSIYTAPPPPGGFLRKSPDETAMQCMGFEGKPAGYFVVFCICAVAYLIGGIVMKTLVPKYKPIVLD